MLNLSSLGYDTFRAISDLCSCLRKPCLHKRASEDFDRTMVDENLEDAEFMISEEVAFVDGDWGE